MTANHPVVGLSIDQGPRKGIWKTRNDGSDQCINDKKEKYDEKDRLRSSSRWKAIVCYCREGETREPDVVCLYVEKSCIPTDAYRRCASSIASILGESEVCSRRRKEMEKRGRERTRRDKEGESLFFPLVVGGSADLNLIWRSIWLMAEIWQAWQAKAPLSTLELIQASEGLRYSWVDFRLVFPLHFFPFFFFCF